MTINWTSKHFNLLTTTELYAILRLRNEVFIVEQHCPYQDIDNKDQKSFHLMGRIGDDLVAYCRILPPGVSYPESSIGRVITSAKSRGTGAGQELLGKAIAEVRKMFGIVPIHIGAQRYLQRFYEGFGFVQTSPVYLEDDIEHIEMILSESH